MKPKSFMLVAGEASGDLLAAELVRALCDELTTANGGPTSDYQPLHSSLQPRFFGAGGPRMAAAGVDLAFDMTVHSVTGLTDVLKNYFKFRRLFKQLYRLALERQPDAIICVDFSGFNRRFAHAIKEYVRSHQDSFHDWNPKLIQYVSPQVWASRAGRAYQMAKDYDLLLSIFPFEKKWYASRVPQFHVEFVGHPIMDRYANMNRRMLSEGRSFNPTSPLVLLLPGSRKGELKRHMPVLLGALDTIHNAIPNLRARLVLPNETLAEQAKASSLPSWLQVQIGGLPESLREADLAIASTGTVTMECAFFGVPTVALYKTSWITFQIGKRIATVRYLAMPNLLADETVFPEFIQNDATVANISRAALDLLRDDSRRQKLQTKLTEIISPLGGPGASHRAATAIGCLMNQEALSLPPAEP